ncbi:hypothetical protein KDL45_08895, partial [bacterium]|nr:hypothetical protein [bacterium]
MRVLANYGIQCLARFDDGSERRLALPRKLHAVAGDWGETDGKRLVTIEPREHILARADADSTQILGANVDR